MEIGPKTQLWDVLCRTNKAFKQHLQAPGHPWYQLILAHKLTRFLADDRLRLMERPELQRGLLALRSLGDLMLSFHTSEKELSTVCAKCPALTNLMLAAGVGYLNRDRGLEGLRHLSRLSHLHTFSLSAIRLDSREIGTYLEPVTSLRSLTLFFRSPMLGSGDVHLSLLPIAVASHLTHLSLRTHSEGSKIDYAFLQRATALKTLSIGDAGFSDTHLAGLSNLRLAGLELRDAAIGDGALYTIATMTSLTSLRLYNCLNVTTAGATQLESLVNLQDLSIYGGPVDSHVLAALARLPKLRTVESGEWITDRTSDVSKLRGLTQLHLHTRRLTDLGLHNLRTLVNLRRLDVAHDSEVSNAGLDALKKHLPALVVNDVEAERWSERAEQSSLLRMIEMRRW